MVTPATSRTTITDDGQPWTRHSVDQGAVLPGERWPAITRAPSGVRAAASGFVVEQLLRRTARRLPLKLSYHDGTTIGSGDAASPTLHIRHPTRLARRIGMHGLVGFGESYMAGEWGSEDLPGVLTVLGTDIASLVPPSMQWLRSVVLASQPYSAHRSRRDSREAVAAHYDLPSDLFSEFLDETMTYSSALFGRLPASRADLADAQRRKIDRLLDAARVGPGTRLLEIGTGWGELSIRAAKRGAQVRSLTLSEREATSARKRVAAAGMSDRVQVDVRDYRDVGGGYDAVISVEMVEAIGFHAWPAYFRAIEGVLRPQGRFALQVITMPHDRMLASRNTHTWMQKYIFPAGLIPSTEAITEITARHTTLRTADVLSLREHYAQTLRLWREHFLQRRRTLSHMGFDEVFSRMWELYLAYAEAGFRSRYLDVQQWTFVREPRGSR